MSQHFGRNKRRAARAAVETAERAAREAVVRAQRAEAGMRSARADAVASLANTKEHIDRAVREITHRLASELPAELLPYAQQLMDAAHREYRPTLAFSAIEKQDLASATVNVVDVRGRIELHFGVRVAVDDRWGVAA